MTIEAEGHKITIEKDQIPSIPYWSTTMGSTGAYTYTNLGDIETK